MKYDWDEVLLKNKKNNSVIHALFRKWIKLIGLGFKQYYTIDVVYLGDGRGFTQVREVPPVDVRKYGLLTGIHVLGGD